MHPAPTTRSLIILGIGALACSRLVFALINDPEGPNLLVVVVLAALIYLLFLAIYWLGRSESRS